MTRKPSYEELEKKVEDLNRSLSEHEAVKKELSQSVKRFELAMQFVSDGLFDWDMKTNEVYFSPAWKSMLGYNEDEIKNDFSEWERLTNPEDVRAAWAILEDVITGKRERFESEFQMKHKEGHWVDILSRGNLIRDKTGQATRLIGTHIDITKRKRMENELRESEDIFRLTFSFSPDAVNINRLEDGLYVNINEGFTRITGYTRNDVIGKTSLDLDIWADVRDRETLIQGLRKTGFFENLEAKFRRKDGRLITGLMSARIISLKGVPHIISISRDISELKRHERELLKVEKLESLGILAGGIAHDFNNILTSIIGNISLAKVYLDSTHKSASHLDSAEKAAVRAGDLAHQLLTFARGGQPIKKVVSLRLIIEEALSLILHGSNVKGIVDIPDSIHDFEADEGQISQVFHNIIINATQAMPEGGTLTVVARNEILYDNNMLSLPPGVYFRLTFSDQGCGISAGDITKIFDPYFTTKPTGNGLGLASAYSIISNHGGHIAVRSVVNEGTVFTIHLPSIGEISTKDRTGLHLQKHDKQNGGTALLMDDEAVVRETAESMLNHLGYKVTTCADGEKAVELYRQAVEAETPFSIVIMDLTIPGGLGGSQAAEKILAEFPEACLIVSSGYSNDSIMSHYRDFGFVAAITKPYNLNDFVTVLNSLPMS